MSYAVREIFYTIQGEGFHTGKPAVFCRFAGCNVWSGIEEHRKRDSAKGGCAAWCDTDFVGGDRYKDTSNLAEAIVEAAGPMWRKGMLVVFTGGEPGLQLDTRLVEAVRSRGGYVAVETNGSKLLPHVDWVCVSPKPPMPVVLVHADEVKVIFPAFNPLDFEHIAPLKWVQAQDPSMPLQWDVNKNRAAEFVMAHPQWRLCSQMHKVMGLR